MQPLLSGFGSGFDSALDTKRIGRRSKSTRGAEDVVAGTKRRAVACTVRLRHRQRRQNRAAPGKPSPTTPRMILPSFPEIWTGRVMRGRAVFRWRATEKVCARPPTFRRVGRRGWSETTVSSGTPKKWQGRRERNGSEAGGGMGGHRGVDPPEGRAGPRDGRSPSTSDFCRRASVGKSLSVRPRARTGSERRGESACPVRKLCSWGGRRSNPAGSGAGISGSSISSRLVRWQYCAGGILGEPNRRRIIPVVGAHSIRG